MMIQRNSRRSTPMTHHSNKSPITINWLAAIICAWRHIPTTNGLQKPVNLNAYLLASTQHHHWLPIPSTNSKKRWGLQEKWILVYHLQRFRKALVEYQHFHPLFYFFQSNGKSSSHAMLFKWRYMPVYCKMVLKAGKFFERNNFYVGWVIEANCHFLGEEKTFHQTTKQIQIYNNPNPTSNAV